jgi:hypothetical protein
LTKSAPATHDEEATPALEVEDDELATRASAEAPTGPELGPSDQLERGTEATAIATVDAHRAPVATPAPTAPVRPAIAARPTPTLATPAPGTIALRAVGAVIRSHANEVQDCAERAQMDHPNLHGRMLFRATVDRFGNVTNAWSDSRLDNGARLTACILARAREWKFPAPAGGTNGSVSYTFVFD